MLPTMDTKNRRSTSKILSDISSSPYADSNLRSRKPKSSMTLVYSSSVLIPKQILEKTPKNSLQKYCRKSVLIQKNDFQAENLAEEFEKSLKERLEKFKNNNSEYFSELEVVESVFFDIFNHFKPFEKLLKELIERIKNCAYENFKSSFIHKIQKLKQSKGLLVQKINSLSDINQEITIKNKALAQTKVYYERLFDENPEFFVNYQNIVDKMLEQCETITNLKKKVKKLKKYEALYHELSKDIQDTSII